MKMNQIEPIDFQTFLVITDENLDKPVYATLIGMYLEWF